MDNSDQIKMLAAADQASKMLAEFLPPMWWGIYRNCIAEGFTAKESLDLLKCYIVSQCKAAQPE